MLKNLILLAGFFQVALSKSSASTPCKWDSKTGAHYDLRPLTYASSSNKAYELTDGDIPCTPELEPTYNYAWNFCADIPSAAIPETCKELDKTKGVVLQWASYPNGGGDYCYSLARDESSQINYSLLDPTDPTKGVSISYPKGEKCHAESSSKDLRSVVVDVHCANEPGLADFVQEPSECNYHISMNSYHGCPTECPVTKGGLCSSHGHCSFDTVKKQAYCYCNEGYGGSDCGSKTTSTATTYDGFSVQLGLLITLLLVAAGLTGGIAYLAWQIAEFRKHQVSNNYSTLSGGEAELVETVNFR